VTHMRDIFNTRKIWIGNPPHVFDNLEQEADDVIVRRHSRKISIVNKNAYVFLRITCYYSLITNGENMHRQL